MWICSKKLSSLNQTFHITVMSATNQNQEIDTLSVKENPDGSFEITWDKNDPNWAFMNGLTNEQVQIIIKQAIDEELKNHD
jgi:hypothetical protein